jgi:hypothetical protein
MPDALWLGGTGAAGRRAERYRWSGHVFAHSNIHILVGGFKNGFYFPYHIWDFILSIDELIFFKMVETTNQYINIIYGGLNITQNHPKIDP